MAGEEELHGTKAGGEEVLEQELFTEEYVTGEAGPREYDYSYRDYGEALPESHGGGADLGGMGPALSAATDQGGVSPGGRTSEPPQPLQPAPPRVRGSAHLVRGSFNLPRYYAGWLVDPRCVRVTPARLVY